MQPTIYHLIGPPAVGKYTIGKELAARAGARLVDNHSVANVLFNLLDQDGVKPLPDGIWPLVDQVRSAVIETLLTLSPRHLSFVFTNFLRGENERADAVLLEMAAVADARDSVFVPVLLRCHPDEIVRRIVGDDRRERLKLVDPVLGRQFAAEVPLFRTDHPHALELDVTTISAAEAVDAIMAWRGRLAPNR